jgi:hypothetical protein
MGDIVGALYAIWNRVIQNDATIVLFQGITVGKENVRPSGTSCSPVDQVQQIVTEKHWKHLATYLLVDEYQ